MRKNAIEASKKKCQNLGTKFRALASGGEWALHATNMEKLILFSPLIQIMHNKRINLKCEKLQFETGSDKKNIADECIKDLTCRKLILLKVLLSKLRSCVCSLEIVMDYPGGTSALLIALLLYSVLISFAIAMPTDNNGKFYKINLIWKQN